MSLSPFDYLNSINTSKKDIMTDDLDEKDYPAFMINRSLSYFNDTVLMANEMNQHAHLDNRLQYDFYRAIVRNRKRFSRWTKADKSKDIDAIKEYYGYSKDKAYQVLSLITKEHLEKIHSSISKGGKKR
jgi:hypothetical protein